MRGRRRLPPPPLRRLSGSAGAFFGNSVALERPFRSDQYGIRAIIRIRDVPLRFEIGREARIPLDGRPDPGLCVPRLAEVDRIAEKLLANADRCQDASTQFRDAADLGMLAWRRGPFPDAAFAKAEAAYGEDIAGKLAWVLAALADPARIAATAAGLGMDSATLTSAIAALRQEAEAHPP